MPKCKDCNDTGVYETGNNDLPCACPEGATALFNQAGVDGPVTGKEIRLHFLNNSPEPIVFRNKPIMASSLPGRKEMGAQFSKLQYEAEMLLAVIKDRQPGLMTWDEFLLERLRNLHTITSKLLGRTS